MSQKKNMLRVHVRALYGDKECSLIYLTSQSYCEDKWFQIWGGFFVACLFVCVFLFVLFLFFFSERALTPRRIEMQIS